MRSAVYVERSCDHILVIVAVVSREKDGQFGTMEGYDGVGR